jgi:solute carrier family 15 oligopeptide transporter 1
MITSLLIFLFGKSMYLMREPTGNVFLSLIKAIKYALGQKRKSSEKKEHWMDYAEGKYTRREIEDIKIVLRVLFLFIPVPLYWALYDQQGSRWTFQASRMDGALGSFTLKPDQLQVINPILVMILIPIFDRVIYPVLAKFSMMKTPLQKMVVGMTFVALAFVVSGVVEIELEKTYPIELEAGEAHVNFMNLAGKNLNATLYSQPNGQAVENFGLDDEGNYLIDVLNSGNYSLTLADGLNLFNSSLVIESERAKTYLITKNGDQLKLTTPSSGNSSVEVGDILEKQGEGQPYIRLMQVGLWEDPYALNDEAYKNRTLDYNKNRTVILDEKKKSKKTYEFVYEPNLETYPDFQSTKELEVEINTYVVYVKTGDDEVEIGEVTLKLGASYVLAVVEDESSETGYKLSISYVTAPNSLHMLWLVPQYFIISCGEIMFSITIMDFCYSQAPKSMKSVMQSAWLMTVAIGNLIDVIIAALKLFDSQWKEFFLFAGLMFADIIIFAYMAYKYVPADIESDDDILKPLEDSKGGNNNTGNANDGYESDKDR